MNMDQANEAKPFTSSSSSCVSQSRLLLVFLSPRLHKVLSGGARIRARQTAFLLGFRGCMALQVRGWRAFAATRFAGDDRA
ncbi:hypothetical protein ZIOFF_064150 [Zingiber officinale]|uniref:Uncharacterized protein n=1 Tax=Zingiber officinale TaxID=94328 RepID=A0A8J5EVQ3_ZINOF|nr:hypothetical protein ZIOFF_064150 [Zingiber officinale]